MPRRMSQIAHAKPAEREAHCESLIMPLFCEKVVFGAVPKQQARNEFTPSASRPPWMRSLTSSGSVMSE